MLATLASTGSIEDTRRKLTSLATDSVSSDARYPLSARKAGSFSSFVFLGVVDEEMGDFGASAHFEQPR